MSTFGAYLAVVLAALLSLLLSTLSYALREVSRARLHDALERRGKQDLLDGFYPLATDLAFVTAVGRLLANLVVLLGVLELTRGLELGVFGQYVVALAIAGALTLLVSVALPHAVADSFGASIVARLTGPLTAARLVLLPLVKIAHGFQALFGRFGQGGNGHDDDREDDYDEYEAEILSYAEEGEQEGSIDAESRQMIERVLAFSDQTVADAMTSRPDIVALPRTATLAQTRQVVIDSGHSRIPVYDGELDRILGVLYARDLITRVDTGEAGEKAGDKADVGKPFDVAEALRPAVFAFEHRPLADLLREFRTKRVHIAVVQDEYGATAGVITIEDVLEELVGEISDEHEPDEPPPIRKIGPGAADCDARLHVDDLNRELGLELSEEEEFDTLAGFVIHHFGRIPAAGDRFETADAGFEVTEAEPHRVVRVTVRKNAQETTGEKTA